MYTGNMKSERKTREKITIHKIAGHLRTVREHRALVRKYCFAVGLYRQGLTHDLSKYTPTELINGFRYYEEESAARITGSVRKKGIRMPGCTIRAEINIIMNTGTIIG